jgi:hypothetical protein
MKTMKILAVLGIVLIFMVNNALSQPVRTERSVSVRWAIPCLNDVLVGTVIFHNVYWYNQKDDSVFPFSHSLVTYDGTLTGLISHEDYTIDFIATNVLHDNAATTTNFVRTIMIRKDGKLVAKLPMKVHTTTNANDEITVTFNESEIICK